MDTTDSIEIRRAIDRLALAISQGCDTIAEQINELDITIQQRNELKASTTLEYRWQELIGRIQTVGNKVIQQLLEDWEKKNPV